MMTNGAVAATPIRPTVSVVMPFFGDEAAARVAASALERLRFRPGDEVVVADNTPGQTFAGIAAADSITVVAADSERSSYHARNVGAERAGGEWLLFLDADCVPPADLLDRYFATPIGEWVGLVAGEIEPAKSQSGLLAEWAATREILSQRRSLERRAGTAATANLLVRRQVWAELGGFFEGIRSGGDFDFCWRAAAAGHGFEHRPDAAVEHHHRESLRGIARQMARYAAGNAWQRRRRPGSAPSPSPARTLARAIAGVVGFGVTLRPRRAALKAVDGIAALAQLAGATLGNSVSGAVSSRRGERPIALVTDRFPVLSETFVGGEIAALRALGWSLRVEAIERPERPALGGARGLDVRYVEDEGVLARAGATAWLLARHPFRALSDRSLRRRFDRDEWLPLTAVAPLARRLAQGGERHVHVHFAALASVVALRAGRLAGVPVSIAAHGHEVFATPRALPEKIRRAAFVAAPCEYTARHLRSLEESGRIGVVVMGVDGEVFRRRAPHPAGRTLVSVGRLVEKKGFGDLVDAVALLEDSEPIDRLLLAGDGPLRAGLRERADAAGLGDRVRLLGALAPQQVRDLYERADLVVVPCVVAADGDRDAMPVVAKEALAMEVPVVATEEVGLPELIDERWGRLVPPGDPSALAMALDELLALSQERRARMGAEGRAFVLQHCSLQSQARRLVDLVEREWGASGALPDGSLGPLAK